MYTPVESSDGEFTDMYCSRFTSKYSDEYDEYDEYDEEMLMMWQFGYGPPPPLHYSAVQLHDVASAGKDDLLDCEKVVRYEDLTPWRATCGNWRNSTTSSQHIGYTGSTGSTGSTSLGYTPSTSYTGYRTADQYLQKSSSGAFLNPSNDSVFCTQDSFRLMLTSRVADGDIEAWRYFASKGLDVFWCGEKVKGASTPGGRRQIIQKLRATLKHGHTVGFLQLFQAAKEGIENSKGRHPYGSLATYFVYRGPERELADKVFPPFVSVFPQARQTYIPMQLGQTLQVILPELYTLSMWDNMTQSSLRKISCCKTLGKFDCHYFNYVQDIPDGYPIFFAARDSSNQGTVIVPPIEEREDRRYAVLHAPMSTMILYVNGIDGIIFRTIDDKFKDRHVYLDRTFNLQVESHYRFSHVSDSQKQSYDLRVRISDKTLTQIQICDLFDGNACKVKTIKTG